MSTWEIHWKSSLIYMSLKICVASKECIFYYKCSFSFKRDASGRKTFARSEIKGIPLKSHIFPKSYFKHITHLKRNRIKLMKSCLWNPATNIAHILKEIWLNWWKFYLYFGSSLLITFSLENATTVAYKTRHMFITFCVWES